MQREIPSSEDKHVRTFRTRDNIERLDVASSMGVFPGASSQKYSVTKQQSLPKS